mmetsp:Transcript_13070/g.12663  ORF Transcript_13070/g.12663 Transcript_13070/m.12663 type:complete len:148 (+) Transcript_13070:93-536(+)
MRTISISSISWIIFALSSSLSFSFKAKLNSVRRSSAGFRIIPNENGLTRRLYFQSSINEHSRYESSTSIRSGPIGNVNELETEEGGPNLKVIVPVVLVVAAAAAAVASGQFGTFDFTKIIEESAAKIENMGPYGYLYFALVSFIHQL